MGIVSSAIGIPVPLVVESHCDECAIRETSICEVLDAAQLARLRSISTIVTYAPNAPLFEEGSQARHVSNVIEGTVTLYKLLPDGRRQILGFLFPGDFVGLALDPTYGCSAEATTTVRMCRFPRERLEKMFKDLPALEHRLLEIAGNEIKAAQEQMLLLGRKTARERLASFLLTLSRRAAARGRAASPVDLPMRRSDIGDYLGLTIETVSRTFTQFKKAGLIGLPNQAQVDILQREILETIAEGG
jgi:CRP/FNR family transcriptional regulator, anaerobic regulatory protein